MTTRATRDKILQAALAVFAQKGYHRALVDDIGLETCARHRELAQILLLESVSLGPAYQVKRLEVHDRFASLIQAHLDEAVAEGSIPSLDTRVATLQWLCRGRPDLLTEAVPALAPLLLRSIGAKPPIA